MKKILPLFLLAISSLFADKVIVPTKVPEIENPWLTGPLITPSSVVVPFGHVNFEPYIYIIANTGSYDNNRDVQKRKNTLWVNSFQPVTEIGLTSWMDCQIIPILFYNYSDHKANWRFGDLAFQFDFQLFSPNPTEDWRPYVKFTIGELFPCGKYRNLDPKKAGVDASGEGSYQTFAAIVLGELFHLGGVHFMTVRMNLQYTLPSPTLLKGFNVYGGGYGTRARFFPAQNFECDCGIEITLAKNWALACDIVTVWAAKAHYSGDPGRNANGTPALLATKSWAQFSLAPALEYNWNENLGVIGGGWFTFAGRNSSCFWSSVIALNYYI